MDVLANKRLVVMALLLLVLGNVISLALATYVLPLPQECFQLQPVRVRVYVVQNESTAEVYRATAHAVWNDEDDDGAFVRDDTESGSTENGETYK